MRKGKRTEPPRCNPDLEFPTLEAFCSTKPPDSQHGAPGSKGNGKGRSEKAAGGSVGGGPPGQKQFPTGSSPGKGGLIKKAIWQPLWIQPN